MNAVVEIKSKAPSIIARIAERYGVDPDKMLVTLKATAFRGDVSNEQMMALCIVADQYKLNPWTKEIYAFPDRNNGIVPVVGVDGWARIINEREELDGIDFNEADDGTWIECVIYRKDRQHPTKVKEWLSECRRDTQPWKSHPRRMLRHKSLIQCARIAFGFGGIYDQDEAERIAEVGPLDSFVVDSRRNDPRGDTTEVPDELIRKWFGAIVDTLNMDKEEAQIAEALREIDTELCKFNELYIVVLDKLARDGVISKANWKKYLKVGTDNRQFHQ